MVELSKKTRAEAAEMILEAELDAQQGIRSQIWVDARDGELWVTNHSQGEGYIRSDESENYICLWRAENARSDAEIKSLQEKPMTDSDFKNDSFANFIEWMLTAYNVNFIRWV